MARLLDGIASPSDLHALSLDELKILAKEIREEIITTVRQTGGHLGASLGAVELILALHSVMDSPRDKIVFDVGHQAYAHKLVTGRLHDFRTLRQFNGVSGFPRREESPHDSFTVGHAGTSISAALGYCLARDEQGEDYKVVSVIGDGALTAGMALEAMNHAGDVKTDIVVILNDNAMSIAPNVGGLSDYLTRLRTDPTYHRAKDDLERLISRIPAVGGSVLRVAERLRDTVRSLVVPGALFEELGFSYYGPIDGHNIGLLQRVLREALNRGGPILVHVHTEKGRGYAPAEEDPARLHAFSPPTKGTKKLLSYSKVMGKTLTRLAESNDKIVAITAAMPEGTGLTPFQKRYPDRCYDVGIAEQHAVTLGAGLSCGGMHPVVALYSTFLQRAYDQVVHDVCLQNLPLTLCLDRGGIVGDDGPTHHGAFDLSYLRHIPNLVVMAPSNGDRLRDMLATAVAHPGPVAIRYPRGYAGQVDMEREPVQMSLGRGRVLREGSDVAFLAIGSMVSVAETASEILQERGIEAAVADACFVKPLDEEMVLHLANEAGMLITLEENVVSGGFGSAVLELMAQHGVQSPIRCLGLPDKFVEHGDAEILRRNVGLDPEHVAAVVVDLLEAGKSLTRPAAGMGSGSNG